MSVRVPPQQDTSPGYTGYYDAYADVDRAYGWVLYAGVLLMILGTINVIEGIAAVGNANFFVNDTHYVIGSLNTWGWVAMCVGAAQWLVGIAVFFKSQFARWVGVAVLSVNAITQLLMMPAYPFWSLCIFALDVLAVYGLIAHGQRIRDSEGS